MVKRKTEISLSAGSAFEGSGLKANWSKFVAKSEQGAATTGPTGQTDFGGVPTGHVEPTPATVAEGEGIAANSFWGVLRLAGYESCYTNMFGLRHAGHEEDAQLGGEPNSHQLTSFVHGRIEGPVGQRASKPV